ncbi:hypothetical protein LR48_Vigan241s000200 [Vigna angularis]|uniref:Uncharacterized protein n=1 Tax=Phaseolus angularis TaxID=3914 RepID=A0A0L9T7C4_PHAAN|nr:hypothetical protein LR48_Vigan241s000200 [Vigna angularis]
MKVARRLSGEQRTARGHHAPVRSAQRGGVDGGRRRTAANGGGQQRTTAKWWTTKLKNFKLQLTAADSGETAADNGERHRTGANSSDSGSGRPRTEIRAG